MERWYLIENGDGERVMFSSSLTKEKQDQICDVLFRHVKNMNTPPVYVFGGLDIEKLKHKD